ncbi:hypothetical protein UT300012_32630 [Paraclostridium bifermentans]
MKKEYLVRVTYDDLRVENEYTEDKKWSSSIELYRELKSKLDVDAIKVEFVVLENGEEHARHTKRSKKIRGENCRQLVGDILTNISKVKNEYEYYSTMMEVYGKRRSTYLHMIEASVNNTYDSFEEELLFKHSIYEALAENESDRRYAKNQLKGLKEILPVLDELSNSEKVKKYADIDTKFKLNSNEMGILSHKDVRYKDEKDKKKVISTYEKDYENYIDDYKNKTICFFNRLGANKYKKPTKIEFETESNKPEKLIVADITEDKVDDKDLNKEIEENNRIIFDYPSNSMKKIILKQNRNKYKYHKVDTRERRIIFSNQEII